MKALHNSMILHGDPLTISQCTFQAHIARIKALADVETFIKAISAKIAGEAGNTEYVCPFAYRLARTRDNNPADKTAGELVIRDGISERIAEDQIDNGDIGSGNKILHLLQRWDIQDAALAVTRVNGGFAMAEILGIRRYKFVVDRAKRLLEHWGNVCSLRKDDDVDLGTSTTVISSPSEKKVGESKEGGGMKEEKWVNFAESARRPKQETKTKEENTAGATPAPSCDDLPRSRLTTLGFEEDTLHRKPVREQGVLPDGLENRRNNRETLSLAQLDISSKTVDFPANHMPSVMGTKGHGRKRGRINHFAAGLLPKEISSSKGDPSENHAAGSSPGSGCPTHKPGNISRCNLPPALDPISADEGLPYNGIVESRNSARQTERKSVATSAALAVSRDGANDVTASRTSSCGTINSPGRITAIVRRACTDLSTDHALQPPPPNYGQRVMIPPIGDREFVSYQLPKLRASSADSITDERLRRTPVARFNTANENTRRSTTPNSMPSRHSARVSSGAWPCENAAEYAGIRLGSNGHSNPSPTIRTLSGPRVQRVLAPKSRRSNSDPAANSNVKSTPIVTAPVRGDESQRTKKALPVQHDETRSKNAQDEKIPEDETLESAHSVGGWQDDCSVASAGPPENVTLEPRRPPSDEG